ncbi:MAG: M20 metallopeptidase family protein [Canibacter sp.]
MNFDQLANDWTRALRQELEAAINLRKQLHQNPRLSGEESDTAARVAAAMGDELNIVAKTGGWIRTGPQTGPSIALRGELDALPIEEKTGLDWASTSEKMHACGHDVHLAALTAVVRAAKTLDLPYGCVSVLQPREESYPSGALEIRESGLFQQQQILHAIGAHVHPGLALGEVSTGGGFVNADASEVEIVITGHGGHGAYPHRANDVAHAVAHTVTGLAEVVRRTADPMVPALLSVGTIQVGTGAANVLPEEGRIFATLRTTSDKITADMVTAVRQFAQGQAAAYGCAATVNHTDGEPALVNDEALAQLIDVELSRIRLSPTEPMRSLGADDFSFFSDFVPSVMCFVGVESAGRASLHDATFLPDDGAIERVAKTLIAGYVAAARRIAGTNSV